MHCLLAYLKTKEAIPGQVKDIYFTDFSGEHQLLALDKSLLLRCDSLHGPMGGHIAAFGNRDSLLGIQQVLTGTSTNWNELINE